VPNVLQKHVAGVHLEYNTIDDTPNYDDKLCFQFIAAVTRTCFIQSVSFNLTPHVIIVKYTFIIVKNRSNVIKLINATVCYIEDIFLIVKISSK